MESDGIGDLESGAAGMMNTHYYAKDCPRGPGKILRSGEREYKLLFSMQDGNEVTIHVGDECINKLRGFVEKHGDSKLLDKR
jgi:hypothetical protein